ncbi:acyltransferase family protein [Paenibacillus dauci]|uniref:acyltransferase family protein n=1 Tax=Paenibacillus dauci TaxID=1567106 RepID=UPI00061956C5|nr:acyltransferase family protein [Paenibacillus dauci]
MPKPLQQHRYMPGLDGLRAFAVLAVIIYHLNTDWAPGGLLGVGIFFVLSGYLITDILAGQWERHHRFAMKDFWIRRARRLLPAMFVMIAVVAVWCLIGDHSRLSALAGDIPAALLYVSNWWFIFHKVSYFESFGPASPLGHLWSLAVEEQFYLLWPFLLLLGLKFLPKRGNLAGWIVSLSIISALLMAVIYVPGEDPSRVYYGTDTRIFALLIGAALAIVWPSMKLKSSVSAPARNVLDGIGTISLLVLIWLVWHTNEYQPFLYRGGMLLIAILTAILIAVLAHPASRLAVIVGSKPLRWLGKRSYGLYLWHFPVITLSTPQVSTEEPSILRAIIQVAVSLALAELSWRYVEEPIRKNGFRQVLNRTYAQRNQWRNSRALIYGGGAAMLFVVSALVLGHVVSSSAPKVDPQQPQSVFIVGKPASTEDKSDSKTDKMPKEVAETVKPKDKTTPQDSTAGQDAGNKQNADSSDNKSNESNDESTSKPSSGRTTGSSSLNSGSTKESTSGKPSKLASASQQNSSDPASAVNKKVLDKIVSGDGVTAIGDSVMLDVARHLSEVMPGITIDGRVGRQMTEAPAEIQQLRRSGHLGSKVIIELGTNGSFTREQLEGLLDELGDAKKIILVNTRVPRPWETLVNDTINAVAAEDSRITVVDWYSASKGQDSFFATDGVHVNPSGAKVFATLVANAIAGK